MKTPVRKKKPKRTSAVTVAKKATKKKVPKSRGKKTNRKVLEPAKAPTHKVLTPQRIRSAIREIQGHCDGETAL